jgi:hypothetical protein
VVDPAGEYYYWTDNRIDGLHRDATDGSGGGIINYGSELGIPGFRPNIEDIVVDPIGERLYIAEDAIDSIVSIALDGSDPKLLVTDEVVGPHAIAVDPIGGRMYWSNSVRLIAFDPNDPPGFGDDVFEPSEYNYAVMSANLDGSDVRKEFYSGLASNVPRDLAVIYVPVPEPETAALAVLTGGAACAVKWRCASRKNARCDERRSRSGILARIARRCFRGR